MEAVIAVLILVAAITLPSSKPSDNTDAEKVPVGVEKTSRFIDLGDDVSGCDRDYGRIIQRDLSAADGVFHNE